MRHGLRLFNRCIVLSLLILTPALYADNKVNKPSSSSAIHHSGINTTRKPAPSCLAMINAANTFLDSLNDTQTQQARFNWDDKHRKHFEFFPPPGGPAGTLRQGVAFRDLNSTQKNRMAEFIKTATSAQGWDKISGIRELEKALGEPPYRDPDGYWVSIFGKPAAKSGKAWGFKFEGHHLSIHASVVDCYIFSSTPAFWGASGFDTTNNPLTNEGELAHQLFNSLSKHQQIKATNHASGSSAIIDKKKTTATYPTDAGISARELSQQQKDNLRQLIFAYAGNMNKAVAESKMQQLYGAGIDTLRFVYTPGYFRIQSPLFVIVHQYQGGADSNHIHSVWRNYNGDWGEDLLERHLRLEHSEH